MSEQVAGGNRAYRNPIADIPDQIVFFALFVVGASAIWSLKLLGFSQTIVTAVPLALMSAYVVVSVVTKRYRIREDKVGDNIYYLGFLFTLVSLAYALYSYKTDDGGTATIITNFGIAILTTIIGLAGRVFFNQMREDPVEYEREARYSLAESANAMRAQLGDIATEASIFKRKLLQVIEEGATEVTTSANRAMEENVRGFAAASNNMTEKVNAAFSTFVDQSNKLNEISANTVVALEALLKRIEQIDVSPQIIAAKFDPIMEKYSVAAEETTKRNRGHAKDMERLRELIEASVTAAETLQHSVGTADKGVAEYITKFGAGLERSVGSAGKLGDSISSATKALQGQSDGQKQAIEGLQSLLASVSKAAQSLTTEMQAAVISHKDVMAQLRASVEGDLRVANDHRAEINKILTDSRAAAANVGGALVSLSKAVTENVGGR